MVPRMPPPIYIVISKGSNLLQNCIRRWPGRGRPCAASLNAELGANTALRAPRQSLRRQQPAVGFALEQPVVRLADLGAQPDREAPRVAA